MDKKSKWLLSRRAMENLLVLVAGILIYVMVSHLDVVSGTLSSFFGIIQPFIFGFGIAYLLNKPVRFFEEKAYVRLKRGRRGLAILTVYLLAFACIVALIWVVVPQVVQSVMTLVNNTSAYVQNLSELIKTLEERFGISADTLEPLLISTTDIVKKVTDLISGWVPQLLNMSVRIGSSVVSGITAVISSIYMLSGKQTLVRQFRKVVYALAPAEKAKRVLGICAHANDVFSGFIVGKLLDSAIIGVICFVGMSILKIPYTALISVIIGITNIIPFFGPFIGAIPSLLILLIVKPISALWMGLFVIALQQFDGNILGPKILGNSTGLSAIWVLVAIIVGGGLFGFAGMILGVPTFAVLYALTSEFLAGQLREKGIDGNGMPLPKQEEAAFGEEER